MVWQLILLLQTERSRRWTRVFLGGTCHIRINFVRWHKRDIIIYQRNPYSCGAVASHTSVSRRLLGYLYDHHV